MFCFVKRAIFSPALTRIAHPRRAGKDLNALHGWNVHTLPDAGWGKEATTAGDRSFGYADAHPIVQSSEVQSQGAGHGLSRRIQEMISTQISRHISGDCGVPWALPTRIAEVTV
jgi:hypothetical protein